MYCKKEKSASKKEKDRFISVDRESLTENKTYSFLQTGSSYPPIQQSPFSFFKKHYFFKEWPAPAHIILVQLFLSDRAGMTGHYPSSY